VAKSAPLLLGSQFLVDFQWNYRYRIELWQSWEGTGSVRESRAVTAYITVQMVDRDISIDGLLIRAFNVSS
jgi:hypothetical protein